MSTVEHAESLVAAPVEVHEARVGRAFWVCRYLPAEVAGTAALVIAGVGVTVWTDAPLLIALAALVGECLGFYTVLALTISFDEHASALRRPRRLLHPVIAEFGPAEAIDTFLVRPVALLLGLLLVGDPVLGLLAGKLSADVVFYTMAARTRARRGFGARDVPGRES